MSVILEPVDGKGLKIPLDKAIVFIGRNSDCDIVITRSRMISRKHCAIVQVNDTLLIRDLGSTNGVRVNRRKVRKEARFGVGDTVSIGDLEYVVTLTKTPEPERRERRDHPQDSRAAGAIPLPVNPAARSERPYSQEVPVAIPEDEEAFDSDALDSDTPDSFPIVSRRKPAEPNGSHGSALDHDSRYSDSDSHIPLSD